MKRKNALTTFDGQKRFLRRHWHWLHHQPESLPLPLAAPSFIKINTAELKPKRVCSKKLVQAPSKAPPPFALFATQNLMTGTLMITGFSKKQITAVNWYTSRRSNAGNPLKP
jgi:hypothetical protein